MNKYFFVLLFVFALVPLASAALDTAETYYAFDTGSGSTAVDSSGNSHTATVDGASWVAGKVGAHALSFDGTNDFLNLSESYIAGSTSFSIVAWSNHSTNVGQMPISTNWAGATSEHLFRINGGALQFYLITNTGSYSDTNILTVATGVWQHYAVVYDGSTVKVYVNGSEETSFSATGTVNTGTAVDYIGRFGANYYSGRLDEIAYYRNQALTPSEVLQLYNSGTGFNPYAPATNTTGNVTFTASEIISGLNISSFNVTIGASTQNNSYVWELAPDNYTAVFSADGYFSKNLTVEVFENVTTQYNFTNISNHQLLLTLSSAVGAGNEGLWEVNLSSDDYSYSVVELVNVSSVTSRLDTLSATTPITQSASYFTLWDVNFTNATMLDRLNGVRITASSTSCSFRVLLTRENGSTSASDEYVSPGSGTSSGAMVGWDTTGYYTRAEFQAKKDGGASGCSYGLTNTYIDSFDAFLFFPELIHGNYTASLSSVGGWVPNSYGVELVSSQMFTYFDIPGYIVGTIEFFFRNSDTNALLSGVNVSGEMVSNITSYSFSTTTGLFNLTNVTSGVYTLTAEAINYSQATVFVTVADDNQTVNVFLEPGAVEILFSVVDTLGNNVPDATLTFLRVINGTPTVVAQTLTDFSGFSFVNIAQGTNYLFTVAASGYITFSGDVTPFSSLSPYTVRLRPDAPTVDNPSTAFVQTFIRPSQAADDSWFYVEFETLSPTGVLSWFAIDSTYLSVTQSDNVSGVPGGGIVSVNFTNINISQSSTVTVQFSFDAVGYDPVVWNQTFVLAEFVGGNFTIQNVFQDAANDLGVVGRHILGSIIVLLALAAGFFASSNASLAGVVGLGAIGLVTVGGLFAVNIAVLAAVFIGILILADNVLGGGA